jgi:uncharacterized protein involved in exopolysaccharide biosynthesis
MPGFLLSASDHEISFNDSPDVLDVRRNNNSKDNVEGDELLIFLRIFLQNKRLLIVSILLGLIISYFVYNMLPRKYRAEATILCKLEEIEDKTAKSVLKMLKENTSMITTFLSDLEQSDKEIVYANMKKEGLLTAENAKKFNSASLSSLIKCSIGQSKNMLVVQASFPEDNKIPAFLANYFAEKMINKIISKIKSIFMADIETLKKALQLKQHQLDKLNTKIVQFIKKPDYIYNTVGENFLATDIYKIDEQLQKVVVQKNSLESEVETLKKQLGISNVSLDNVKWISGDNILVKKISELKAQKNVLLGKYTSDNPKIIQLNYQIQSLERLLNDNGAPGMKKIVVDMSKSQMVTELALKYAKVQSINLEVEYFKKRKEKILKKLAEIPLQDSELKSLLKERNILKDSIKELLTTIDKKQTFLSKLNSNFQIIKRAQIPEAPYFPKKHNVFLIGPLVMFLLTICWQILRFSISPTLVNEFDIGLKLKLRCRAVLPSFKEKNKVLINRKVGRIMSKVVTALKKESLKNPVILVTSPNKNDGKTFVASWFAITAAMLDYKTLYIKLPDPESLTVHTDKKGLINYFQGEDSLDEWSFIWKTKWTNLFYLPPGHGVDKRTLFEKIDRNRIKDFLYFARAHFDIIVLDGGSLPSSMETTIFIHETDITLLVIASKRDKVEEVQEIIDIVGKENVRIILNYVPKKIVQTVTIKAKRAVNSVSSALRLMGVSTS